jgi:hypothetical protein
MSSNLRNHFYIPKPLICIYTNHNKKEFAIGLEKEENFRTITKVGESYTRFVDAYDQIIDDKIDVDWELELRRWRATAKKNESIFAEINLSDWNQDGERSS